MKRIKFALAELQALVAVADTLSFRAAAERLFVSQPALSRRIDKLELELGARLLERTTRRVALTDAGRQFLLHARAALDALDSAVTHFSLEAQQRNTRLTVACVPSVASYLLPTVLKAFCAQYPHVHLRVVDESAQEVLRCVLAGEAEIGVNFMGVQERDIEFRPIYSERYVLAVRRDHALAARKSVRWAELLDETMIGVAASSWNRALIDHALARLPRRPTVSHEANHVAGAIGMVQAGLGVAALPQLSLFQDAHPALVGIPLVEPAVSRTLGLIQRKGHHLSEPASALYALLHQALLRKRR